MPLIFGETSSGLMVPVQVDADGKIQADNYGLVGGSFQKDPIRLGYSGDQTEEVSDTSASEGLNTLSGATVPAGEIWVIEGACIRDANNAPSRVLIYATVNSVDVILMTNNSPVSAVWDTWSGAITLSEGDKMQGQLQGVTLNDDIYLRYHGRTIDIDQ